MPELIPTYSGNVMYYRSPELIATPGVRHAFFTRIGGVSSGAYESLNFRFNCEPEKNVKKNFTIAADVMGLDLDRIAITWQQHTDRIEAVTSMDGFGPVDGRNGVDALVTDLPGVGLCGFYADCQLAMFYDRRARCIGVAHAGWRGVCSHILPRTIEKMTSLYGSRPRDITVAVSPSICRRCFCTDDDVYEAVIKAYGSQVKDFIYREDEKWHIDLKSITYYSLVSAGVLPQNVGVSSLCTCCGDEKQFWSHRRMGEERGVHAGMICMM